MPCLISPHLPHTVVAPSYLGTTVEQPPTGTCAHLQLGQHVRALPAFLLSLSIIPISSRPYTLASLVRRSSKCRPLSKIAYCRTLPTLPTLSIHLPICCPSAPSPDLGLFVNRCTDKSHLPPASHLTSSASVTPSVFKFDRARFFTSPKRSSPSSLLFTFTTYPTAHLPTC